MKIEDIKTNIIKHTIPNGKPVPFGPRGSIVLVRLETDVGITGIGDAMTHCFYHEAGIAVKDIIEKGFKNLLVGENPLEIRKIWRKLYFSEMYVRQHGLGATALSAIDNALMDIAGKYWKVPVYELLGGRIHEKIMVYASDLFDMKEPSRTIEKVIKFANKGFPAVKLGYGGFGHKIEESIDIVKQIRDAVGYDLMLMVDGPATLTTKAALKLGNALEKFEVFWWEEPLPKHDIEGYIELSRKLEMNIAAGEQLQTAYEFRNWIVKRAVDIIQPDVAMAGGLSECKRIADIAELWNVRLCPHSWSTAINFIAAAHLVATLPWEPLLEFRTIPTVLMNELLKKPIEIKNGFFEIASNPGLGIELNEEIIEKYRIL